MYIVNQFIYLKANFIFFFVVEMNMNFLIAMIIIITSKSDDLFAFLKTSLCKALHEKDMLSFYKM